MNPNPSLSDGACPDCGQPVMSFEAVRRGVARYYDTLGGHADRHTLVLEAAERAVTR